MFPYSLTTYFRHIFVDILKFRGHRAEQSRAELRERLQLVEARPAMNVSSIALEVATRFTLGHVLTRPVNQPRPLSFLWVNIPVSLLSVAANSWAAASILKADKTALNKFIVCDCFLNIFTVLLGLANQSPWQGGLKWLFNKVKLETT